jgi:hypothetical protein
MQLSWGSLKDAETQTVRLDKMQHELHLISPSNVYTVKLELLADGRVFESSSVSICVPGPPDTPVLSVTQTELDAEHGGHSLIASLCWSLPVEYPPRFITGYQLMANGVKVWLLKPPSFFQL